jgi:hypothetical protein
VAFDGLNHVTIPPERADRVVRAVLENIANWEERLRAIEEAATPITGNKARALSLLRDMEQTKVSLKRLAGLPETD